MCAGWNSSVANIALTVQFVLLVAAYSGVVLSAQDNEEENVEDRQGKEASKCTDQSSAHHPCCCSFSVGVELLCHQDCQHSDHSQQRSSSSVGKAETSAHLCSFHTPVSLILSHR